MSASLRLAEHALPAAAAVAAAVFTYMLTGGVEEYPGDAKEEPAPGTEERAAQPMEDEAKLSDLDRTLSKIEAQLQVFGERLESLENKPHWANELYDLTKVVSTDVYAIRAGLGPAGTSRSPAAALCDSVLPGSTPSPLTTSDIIAQLCDAVWAFCAGLPSGTLCSAASVIMARDSGAAASDAPEDPEAAKQLRTACDTLLMFVGNLIKSPDVARYRRLLMSNTSFRSSLASCSGHDKVLESLGFVARGGAWELTGFGSRLHPALDPSQAQGEALRVGQALLEAAKRGRGELLDAMRLVLFPAA